MEQGEKEPTLSQLYTLARLLGVDASELSSNLPMSSQAIFDYPKFKELVAIIASKGAGNGSITKTKLSILSYLVDFSWYQSHGASMTGATYRLGLRGPVADDLLRAIDELYEGQALTLEPQGTAFLITAVSGETPTTLITPSELSLIEAVCGRWRTRNTEAINNFVKSQTFTRSIKPGDPIPYEAILQEPKDSVY